jgi:hypothetical protein
VPSLTHQRSHCFCSDCSLFAGPNIFFFQALVIHENSKPVFIHIQISDNITEAGVTAHGFNIEIFFLSDKQCGPVICNCKDGGSRFRRNPRYDLRNYKVS